MKAGIRVGIQWAAAIGMAVITAGLSHWQWQRAQLKDTMLAQAEQHRHSVPWGAAQWPCPAANASSAAEVTEASALPRFQPAVLEGRWLSGLSVWLDNRVMDDATGFILVTPLLLTAPTACAGQVVLVERGWVPRDPVQRDRLPDLPRTPDAVQVVGHVEPVVSAAYALGQEPDGTESWPSRPPIRQNADAAFWQRWLARAARGQSEAWRLSPGVLRQHDGAGAADGLRRHWPMGWQGTSPERHRAYAFQWAALSALSLALALWFLVIRPLRHDDDVHVPTLHV